jgi:hypothetical protein
MCRDHVGDNGKSQIDETGVRDGDGNVRFESAGHRYVLNDITLEVAIRYLPWHIEATPS